MERTPIVEQCVGCSKVTKGGDINYCQVYLYPEKKWAPFMGKEGLCNMASHVERKEVKKRKFNPIKASKRGFKVSY
jgi:hypothetical protein